MSDVIVDGGLPEPRQADARAATVQAVGKLSEALETTERARGRLYDFHQLTGRADEQLGEAARALRAAGHVGLADRIESELVGRNVLEGRWTYQVVEEYDDGYWEVLRRTERLVREQLLNGRRHVHESELKEQRRTRGRPGHEPSP